jgi:hypothetical protein
MREQQPKPETSEPENQDRSRPVWFLGQEHAPKAAEAGPGESKADAEKRQRHLEAYKRYKQMRESAAVTQREDFEEDEPPLKSRRLPAYNPDARVSRRRTDEWFDDAYGDRQRKPRRSRSQRNLTRDFAIAGVLSVVTGLIAGVVVYDRTSNGAVTQALLSTFDGVWSAQAEKPAVQPAQAEETQQADASQVPADNKKPIATATLDVADVAGNASALIPLSLRAIAAEPGQMVGFRLSGLPDAAFLTAGIKLNETTWQLRPGEEKGLKLKLPVGQTQSFVIAVEAIEPTTNDLVSPIHEMNVALTQSPQKQTVVMPAATEAPEVKRNFNIVQEQPAAQEQPIAQEQPAGLEQPAGKTQVAAAMPIPSPIEETSAEPMAETFSLMRNGDKLMSMGDPAGARQFYLKALNLGDKQAALKVGQTYDPTVFAEMNVQGLKPDPQLALRYYLEARTAGDPEAETSISGLDSWMQR